jgi:hypothetical protein
MGVPRVDSHWSPTHWVRPRDKVRPLVRSLIHAMSTLRHLTSDFATRWYSQSVHILALVTLSLESHHWVRPLVRSLIHDMSTHCQLTSNFSVGPFQNFSDDFYYGNSTNEVRRWQPNEMSSH